MYSDFGNQSQVYELTLKLGEIRLGDDPITKYFNSLKRLWQDLDLFNNYEWKSPEDARHYQRIVEAHRIYKFLVGLNVEFDEVRGCLIGKTPLPSLSEVFAEVRREESRRHVMLGKKTISGHVKSSALVGAEAERRQTANQRAIKTLEQYGATRLEVDLDGSFSYPEPQFNTKDNAVERQHSLPKPLKTDEEQLMRVFYEFKIQEVCKAFGFPHKIQATAIIYFKRFYLHWSVMEHHPKHIMLTCIYASCKVEENHVSAEELGKGIQQDHQIILNNEMIVLQSLEFDLIIYAPYRSIEGFVDDMEDFCQANNHTSDKLQILREVAKAEVDKIMLTDAPLLFSPGQLSLAALRKAMEEHKVLSFERYMESIFSRQRSSHSITELNESLSVIDSLVRKLKIPTNEDMKPIDRKLQKCQENKKREKKSKHKSKRASSEMQGGPAAS